MSELLPLLAKVPLELADLLVQRVASIVEAEKKAERQSTWQKAIEAQCLVCNPLSGWLAAERLSKGSWVHRDGHKNSQDNMRACDAYLLHEQRRKEGEG